ncbi:Gfo/Idh/MocA family oxidoreductase [Inquilinus sp. KBS0705]|nr:Gfo/Idh/MocA family oxidoreductase [Inquilinus sp. KBS0705]
MTLQQRGSMPKTKQQIIIIGAGGIVNDAHLPAYKIAEFEVIGIYDIDTAKAKNTALRFSISKVYESVTQMIDSAPSDVIFDIALPGNAIIKMLQKLPANATVLMQKPIGENYKQAKKILQLTREKNMLAGVNFQLRYAPFIIAARDMIKNGTIGDLCDIEINVNVFTPWHLWDFLYKAPRVEIPYHSIHYIDVVRSFLGNPSGIYAKTVKHPQMRELATVRSNIIMDYGDMVRANILTNHCHQFGLDNQQSYIKFEGTKGAIKIKMGTLMNYPAGVPDKFEYVIIENGKASNWKAVEIEGSWFPHAFIGSIAEMMKAKEGTITHPDNSVEDCIHTMACVEAAYISDAKGAVKLSSIG